MKLQILKSWVSNKVINHLGRIVLVEANLTHIIYFDILKDSNFDHIHNHGQNLEAFITTYPVIE